MKLQKLYRPVGLKELKLILESDARGYPPRLDWQPIFYPVLNFDYAAQIASGWNLKDEASDFSGFVTEFEIDAAYLKQFDVQNVGGHGHNELWVPAEQLSEFNAKIQDQIQTIAAYYGERYEGKVEKSKHFVGLGAMAQLQKLRAATSDELRQMVQDERTAILANFVYWCNQTDQADLYQSTNIFCIM